MTLGDQVDEGESFALLDIAMDHGVTVFDTANSYNAGRSEEIVGRWLKRRGVRDGIVLSTKVRYAVGDDPNTVGLAPRVITREIDASLRRLDTDYVDIYYLHQPDDDVPIVETWECLDRLVTAGKVRCIGLSNFAAWQIVEAIYTAREHGWPSPAVTQPIYNLVARGAEGELWPMVQRFNLAACVYNPLAGGLLTGKHSTGDDALPGTRLATSDVYRGRYWHSRQRQVAARFCELAVAHGRTATELAMRFVLDAPAVTSVLVGASARGQLEETLKALDAPALSSAERAVCDELWKELSGPVPRYYRTNREPSA